VSPCTLAISSLHWPVMRPASHSVPNSLFGNYYKEHLFYCVEHSMNKRVQEDMVLGKFHY
jgi:hypothetical protein